MNRREMFLAYLCMPKEKVDSKLRELLLSEVDEDDVASMALRVQAFTGLYWADPSRAILRG